MTTENTAVAANRPKPRITLSADDYERLSVLVRAVRNRMPDLADELAEEIGRAYVLAKGRHPKHIVCMNSEVEFRDQTIGRVRRVELVYPEDADIAQCKISVLTPVGTALIGLHGSVDRIGDSERRGPSTHGLGDPWPPSITYLRLLSECRLLQPWLFKQAV